jgi:hypothetical protein
MTARSEKLDDSVRVLRVESPRTLQQLRNTLIPCFNMHWQVNNERSSVRSYR